jgi:hypothetical protein
MEEWQEKLHRSAGPLALGYREEVGKISETRQWPVAHRHLNAPPPEQLQIGYSSSMEVTTVFSRSFPETTALQLNSWHLDDTVTHRGSYAFGNGELDEAWS